MTKNNISDSIFENKPFTGHTNDTLIIKLKPFTEIKNDDRIPKQEEWESNLVNICRYCKRFNTMFNRAFCEMCYENKTQIKCEKCKDNLIPHHRVLCDICWDQEFAEKIIQEREKEEKENNEAIEIFKKRKEEKERKERERREMFRKIKDNKKNDIEFYTKMKEMEAERKSNTVIEKKNCTIM